MAFLNEPVLNIIVVGFHHKKGCQVEHCYPELVPGRPSELPAAWRHLPALALPDGSHNYLSDTIFFNLPGLTEPAHTVYGISCFRQIPIEQVVQKTEDMTRSSVQKSVCVVCRAPLFGRLSVKMELVVRAWFLQGDFSQTKLLEDAFKHLNSCPLVLLRRKVLIYGSPAGPLSAAVLTLVSLLPQCLESGLSHAANVVLTRPLSPMPAPDDKNLDEKDAVDANIDIPIEKLVNGSCLEELSPKETGNLLDEKDRVSRQSFDEATLTDVVDRQEITSSREKCHSIGDKYKPQKPLSEAQQSPTMARDMSVDGLYNMTGQIDQTEYHVVRHGATQGDLWIRDQFATYLIYLLRTSLLPDGSRELESFNALFMAAFKATPAYERWFTNTNSGQVESFLELAPAHPFSGQLSVADMKLKFAHTMSTTEGGRKVSAAVASTGRAVATTSRAVGGAFSQARGALTGWWSALTAPPSNSGASDTPSIGELTSHGTPPRARSVACSRAGGARSPHPPPTAARATLLL
ncbi:Uncharacterized protein OBRU01_13717 [Operophtera brumata]|uniref:AVL9/DENND6 domain-containing protein n=1 Tax=Operophtera brumata TaxID=104452 RepID=A0A0L7L7W7_OPEBR|nr:Uncharacterized protein OBRU01_13717 [Operophtera brumata]